MYAIIYRPNILKIILSVIIVCIYTVGVYYFINFYFIHSTIIFILIVAISLLLILRAIGIFLMYPGSFRYLTAQVQKKQNDNLLCNIHQSLNKIQEITNKIATQQIVRFKGTYYQLYATNIMKTIQLQLNTLQKCQNPSDNKRLLIVSFQQLIRQLNSYVFAQGNNQSQSGSSQRQFMMDSQITQQYDHSKFSLSMIFNQPKLIHKIKDGIQYNRLQQKSIKIMNICRKIWELCCTISTIPTHDTKKNIKKINNFQSTQQMANPNLSQQQKPIQIDKCEAASWHLFQQKLFTIDSYFAYWDNLFEYTRLMVPVGHGNFIQCAIIHSQKITQSKDYQKIRQKTSKYPGILFSNPNGAIFQQLVLYSSYINFYLKWGFQVVLWNYRGYGKSTGFSTISHAIADIEKVYKYISKEYIINIQVLHGYSIGGSCSIKLAHKLNKKSQKPIKILIADRTFSSIDRVPQGLIKQKDMLMKILKTISSPIVKLLFISQCFDNSEIFLDCDCKKVIIYDIFDQIITKQASLKHGIQKYVVQQGHKIGDGKQESLYFNYQQLKINLSLFSTAICQIYKKDKTICEQITTIMSDTDGGGSSLFLKFGTRKTQNNKQLSLHKVKAICQSYFIGIFLYGPKLSIPNFPDDLKKQQWIEKRIQNKIELLTRYKQKIKNNQNKICIKQITDIITAITFLKQNLKIQQIEQKQKRFGHLIVSEVGHNRQLKKQFVHFQQIFCKIYRQPQNKLKKIKNEMFQEQVIF